MSASVTDVYGAGARFEISYRGGYTISATDDSTRIGADVGGTFTDVILQRADGSTQIRKLLSTPPTYDAAVVEAVAGLRDGARVSGVVHGTTVATNAVLERRGARAALVTTAGFRDVLELRRLRIPRMYEPFWRKPEPLVARRLRFEVGERMAADGAVLRPLDESEARALAATMREADVESVAVCLLHSYLYPAHEERLGAILREELPDVYVSLSSEILREQREYERSATTVVNAYVRPLMERYVGDIRRGLDAAGVRAPLTIMQSSGGVMTADDAKRRPVLALESGPAAGVVAALGIARRLGYANAIAFDMGGTTAKASLIEHGAVARGREYEVGGALSAGSRLMRGSGELLRIPTIDIAEVGAGGGSLAWLDRAGGLQVGPRSAGADPGPACYGRGGVEPAVTDANVVLGYIPEGPLADGQISISRELGERALERVGVPLGLATDEVAAGIHAIANARMTRALRSVSSEKGRDPRDFALIAYGGAGPVHAVGLAEELGCRTVLVPALAGLFSALGLLFARPEFHAVRTCHLDARAIAGTELDRVFDELRAGLDGVEFVRSAELRYGGQTWEIEVDAGDPVDLEALVAAFENEHERLYGVRGEPGSPVEIRALRLAGLGPSSAVERLAVGGGFAPRETVRETALGTLPVRSRASVGEQPEPGPLLVDEYDTTVVVRPGWTARREPATETLVLERAA
ncbi:MAG TPA: hydantoinase/oxoprolinase family protein [Gaiellaceae bacterium]|nr:hydantoinase/oxoprolinase family protein [Gaiellaceae bacterium]